MGIQDRDYYHNRHRHDDRAKAERLGTRGLKPWSTLRIVLVWLVVFALVYIAVVYLTAHPSRP